MFKRVAIRNFKSIRDVQFDARRVNLFIGEPNTGKSNLLEALALFSTGIYSPDVFKEVMRFRTAADLVYDHDISLRVEIEADGLKWSTVFQQGEFLVHVSNEKRETAMTSLDQQGLTTLCNVEIGVRYYRFKTLDATPASSSTFLMPPFGSNLAQLIYTDKGLRRSVSDLFRSKGFRLEIKPMESEISMVKEVGGDLFSYPYETISETLRRVVFFIAAIDTNHDAVLLLDEPEANTFPFYTKFIAEKVAFSESNQFFITTHNPFILSSIVEKTPIKDLAVFVTQMSDFETKVVQVPDDGLSKILDLSSDVFLNLDKLVAA